MNSKLTQNENLWELLELFVDLTYIMAGDRVARYSKFNDYSPYDWQKLRTIIETKQDHYSNLSMNLESLFFDLKQKPKERPKLKEIMERLKELEEDFNQLIENK